jgi:hypothetical protein
MGFEEVVLRGSIGTRRLLCDKSLCLGWRDAQVQDQAFAREAVDVVFEMLDPSDEFGAFFCGSAGGLMGKIRTDIAVGKNNLAVAQSRFERRLGFEAIAGVEKGREVRIERTERAEIAVEELADEFAESGTILREASGKDGVTAIGERAGEEFNLRAFAAAIDAFNGDEFSGAGHYAMSRGGAEFMLKFSLTAESRRCNAAHARILNRPWRR